jgi:hypothetical protein
MRACVVPDYLRPLPAPPSGPEYGGLGAIPIAAVPVAISTVNRILGGLGLSSSDPAKDAIRFANIDRAFALAMEGDTRVYAELGNRAALPYLQIIAAGGMESGSKAAAAYAKVKLAEYQARYAAGVVGVSLIGQSTIPTTVVGTVQAAASSPLTWLLVGGVVFFVLRRRGR